MPCFYCGKPVSVLRKLTDPDFCCDEHRDRYHELAKLALQRLVDASPATRRSKEAERERAESAAAAGAHERPSPPPRAAEEPRIPPAAGPKEAPWSRYKEVASCFIAARAAGFALPVALPRTSRGPARGAGLPWATHRAIPYGAAMARAGRPRPARLRPTRGKLLLPGGPSLSAASPRVQAAVTPPAAHLAALPSTARLAGGALRKTAQPALPGIQSPGPSWNAMLGAGPAVKVHEPRAVIPASLTQSCASTGTAPHLRLPVTMAQWAPVPAFAAPAGIQPGRQSRILGAVRAAGAVGLAPKTVSAAPACAGPRSSGAAMAETFSLSPSAVEGTALPVCAVLPAVLPIVKAAAGVGSRTAALSGMAAITAAPETPIAPQVSVGSPTISAAPALAPTPRTAFPRVSPRGAEALGLSRWLPPEPPAPAILTSLGVGSGSALGVSVVLPATRQHVLTAKTELLPALPAPIPTPEIPAPAAVPAASPWASRIPQPGLTACITAGPAVASSLGIRAPGLPELRPVLHEAGWRPAASWSPVVLAPPIAARWQPPPPITEAPAPAPAVLLLPPEPGPGAPSPGSTAGPGFSIRVAGIPRIEGERRGVPVSAGYVGLELRAPEVPGVRVETVPEIKAVPAVLRYPTGGPTARIAGIAKAASVRPGALSARSTKLEGAGSPAGWLIEAAAAPPGPSGVNMSIQGIGAPPGIKAIPAAVPLRLPIPSQAGGDLVTGLTGKAPRSGFAIGPRTLLEVVGNPKDVAPGAARARQAEAPLACSSPAPLRAALLGSQAAPEAAHSFARYPERDVGPRPRAGSAHAVAPKSEPVWRARAKWPAAALSPVTVEFELPPTPPVWIQVLNLWRGLPAALRAVVAWMVLVIGLSMLVWVVAGQTIATRLEARAAIQLHEDFRQGLRAWMGPPGWTETWRRHASGVVEVSQLALWRPTRKLSDYRLEFLGQLSGKTMGWVFRAGDLDNYYSMKLAVVKPGPLPTVALVRSVVVAGREQERVQVPLRTRVHQSSPVRVRLLVRGDGFTTWIGDQLADYWRDDRFRQGAVGLFAETGDRAQIFWVRVTHQDDFLGKLCAYLAPSQREEY